MTRREKLIRGLQQNLHFTAKQIVKKYRYASPNSVSGTITHLRNAGMNVASFYHKSKNVKYAIPTENVKLQLAKSGYSIAA